jgi:deoxyribodipyrimidine photo-lyase
MRPRVRYPAEVMSTVVWFRQDLRLDDNPALNAAVTAGEPIIPVYLYSPEEEGAWAPGGATRWWLHHSLQKLASALTRLGSRLILLRAPEALPELRRLLRECGGSRLAWNRRYEPASIARDKTIKSALQNEGMQVLTFNGGLLREPWEVANKAGGPFQVFTPFWRHCLSLQDPEEPQPSPPGLTVPSHWPATAALQEFDLLPRIDWTGGLRSAWEPGSEGATQALQRFLGEAFEDYANGRDRPGEPGTSRLSPHLHFGEISPRQVWHAVRRSTRSRGQHSTWRQSQFLTEVGWREFAHHLIYHFPHTPQAPLRAGYAHFPWRTDPQALSAWQRGLTGYPLVDAGMRQLWQTGWMHNRVRMIAASFLVKDLLLPWNTGADWFWDTLVDADLASNTLGWQWVAGCGADAAPYFRIFNPITQATRFDPEGTYVREWVPELARLPGQWLQQPWAAPPDILRDAGVRLGTSYPQRIVDHAYARERALTALATLDKRTL